jgi:hypothetical protein
MEWRDDCPLDIAIKEAKYHGMTAEEFLSMPEKQKHDVYCGPFPTRDCHAKRKYNTKS